MQKVEITSVAHISYPNKEFANAKFIDRTANPYIFRIAFDSTKRTKMVVQKSVHVATFKLTVHSQLF